MPTDAETFLTVLSHDMPPTERLILCGFEGDPGKAEPRYWRPRPWKPGTEIPFEKRANGYVTVASFGRAEDRTFRRRSATFAAGRALMVDDVGTKVDRSVAKVLKPSAIIETSKGNEQHWYFLKTPIYDPETFDGIIRAFIAGQLLGADPGMAGITRVGRLPGYTNGKPQHNGFRTRLLDLNDQLYEPAALLAAFKLQIKGRNEGPPKIDKHVAVTRAKAFDDVWTFLKAHGMLKRSHSDAGGWTEMHCPWMEDHTDEVDNGAAIREPKAENQYYGAFRCHHGHCQDKGWKDLTDWIDGELAAPALAEQNDRAPATLDDLLKELL